MQGKQWARSNKTARLYVRGARLEIIQMRNGRA